MFRYCTYILDMFRYSSYMLDMFRYIKYMLDMFRKIKYILDVFRYGSCKCQTCSGRFNIFWEYSSTVLIDSRHVQVRYKSYMLDIFRCILYILEILGQILYILGLCRFILCILDMFRCILYILDIFRQNMLFPYKHWNIISKHVQIEYIHQVQNCSVEYNLWKIYIFTYLVFFWYITSINTRCSALKKQILDVRRQPSIAHV